MNMIDLDGSNLKEKLYWKVLS